MCRCDAQCRCVPGHVKGTFAILGQSRAVGTAEFARRRKFAVFWCGLPQTLHVDTNQVSVTSDCLSRVVVVHLLFAQCCIKQGIDAGLFLHIVDTDLHRRIWQAAGDILADLKNLPYALSAKLKRE